MADFFELTPEEKKILAEVAEKLEPHLDEILAEWVRTLDRTGFFDRAPMPRETVIQVGEQAMRGHIAAMKSGNIEEYAARVHKQEILVPAAQQMRYDALAMSKSVFHSLCYQRVSVLYEDPSARRAALAVLSKEFEAALARAVSFFAETREQAAEAQRIELQRERERLHHRTLQLETSAEVSRRITAALELDELLSQVVELVKKTFGYYHVHIYLADYEANALVMREGTGEPGRIMKERGHRIEMGRGLVGRAATSGKSVLVPDVSQEPAWLPNPLLPETRSELSVPLILGDRVIGVLDVQDNEVGGLTEDDLILLEGLGAQIAVAIENARLFQAERRRYQVASTLQEVARILSSTLDLKDVPDMILEQLARVVDYDSAAIFLLSDGLLKVVAGRGFPDMERIMGMTLSVEENALFRQICHEKRPLVLADAQKDERFLGAGGTGYVRGWIGAPLIVKGEIIGSLTVDSRQPGAYDEETAQTVFLFASQAALAIENARLFNAEARRRQEAETLRRVAQTLTVTLDLDEVLDLVLEQLQKVVPYDAAAVQLLTDRELKIIAGRGFPEPERVLGMTFPIDADNPNRQVVSSKQPVIIPDAQAAYPAFREPPHNRIRSWLGVPIIFRDHLIGMLSIDREEVDAFTTTEAQLAMAFANQTAVAIENARLFAQAQEQVRKLQVAIEAQERLTRTVRELSSPVVQVWENVLALPLVGGIDATRAKQITEELLTGIVKHQAEMVIIDITGVPVVDTQVANYILQTIKAASLLGAHCVLVGISAEVAQAMISLGVDLSAVTTLSNLQAGIQYALEKMGLGVAPLPPADAEEAFPGDLELARGAPVKE